LPFSVSFNPLFPDIYSLKDCNGHTVVQVTDLLRKQGFLQATPGCKSKGFLEKGLPKYSIPRSPEMKERIRREILDPMVKIKHHVNPPFILSI
jgi:hypothetical protein